MKKTTLIMLIITCISFSSSIKADEKKQVLLESESALPSTKTQSQLENLAPGKIGTRQAPDEEGTAQKETPLSGMSISVILLMITSSLCYVYLKKINLQNTQK